MSDFSEFGRSEHDGWSDGGIVDACAAAKEHKGAYNKGIPAAVPDSFCMDQNTVPYGGGQTLHEHAAALLVASHQNWSCSLSKSSKESRHYRVRGRCNCNRSSRVSAVPREAQIFSASRIRN